MFERVKRLSNSMTRTRRLAFTFVHGTSWLLDVYAGSFSEIVDEGEKRASELALDWFRLKKKRGLLAPTVSARSTALMSVLHVKHGFLRLFGLAGKKLLIIDEVHAYDAWHVRNSDAVVGMVPLFVNSRHLFPSDAAGI